MAAGSALTAPSPRLPLHASGLASVRLNSSVHRRQVGGRTGAGRRLQRRCPPLHPPHPLTLCLSSGVGDLCVSHIGLLLPARAALDPRHQHPERHIPLRGMHTGIARCSECCAQLFGYSMDGLSTVFLALVLTSLLGAGSSHLDIQWLASYLQAANPDQRPQVRGPDLSAGSALQTSFSFRWRAGPSIRQD